MKPISTPLPNMYEEKKQRPPSFLWSDLRLLLWVVLLLLLLRMLNLSLCWFLTRSQLSHLPPNPEIRYVFLDLASKATAEKALSSLPAQPQSKVPPVLVVAYFNLADPASFLIQNNSRQPIVPIELGRVILPLKPGFYHLTQGLGNTLTRHFPNRAPATITFNTSILDSFITPPTPDPKEKKTAPLSYILKETGKNPVPLRLYPFYLLLPLLAILLLGSSGSRALWTAYLYFPICFLVFDYKEFFFRTWIRLFTPSPWSPTLITLEQIVPFIVALFFLVLGAIGLYHWRKRSEGWREPVTVLFFLLLPIFLRF